MLDPEVTYIPPDDPDWSWTELGHASEAYYLLWTEANDKQAICEGWFPNSMIPKEGYGLCDIGISRVSCPELEHKRLPDKPRFATHADALVYVTRMAEAGSQMHQLALTLFKCEFKGDV